MVVLRNGIKMAMQMGPLWHLFGDFEHEVDIA
jgi:hypothetical protein